MHGTGKGDMEMLRDCEGRSVRTSWPSSEREAWPLERCESCEGFSRRFMRKEERTHGEVDTDIAGEEEGAETEGAGRDGGEEEGLDGGVDEGPAGGERVGC